MDASCTDEEIHTITSENSCTSSHATVGAVRALANDVDTTRMTRNE